MKPLSRTPWVIFGSTGIALIVLAMFVAAIDGVPAVFLLYGAMLAGGISGIGVNSNARNGLVVLSISTLIVLGMMHYSPTTGLVAPSLAKLRAAFAIIVIPLAVSAGLLA